MWEENFGTQAGVHLIEGIRLIWGPLNPGFTVASLVSLQLGVLVDLLCQWFGASIPSHQHDLCDIVDFTLMSVAFNFVFELHSRKKEKVVSGYF